MNKGYLQRVLELELRFKLHGYLQHAPLPIGTVYNIRIRLFDSRFSGASVFSHKLAQPEGLNLDTCSSNREIKLGGEVIGLITCEHRRELSHRDLLTSLLVLVTQVLTRHLTRKQSLHEFGHAEFWIGNSAALLSVEQQCLQLAEKEQHVLITGPDGTGKSLAAYAVHSLATRNVGNFITLRSNGPDTSQLDAICDTLKVGDTLYVPVHRLSDFSVRGLLVRLLEKHLPVRLIFSSQRDIAIEGFAKLELPTLESRQEDIWPLLQHYLSCHGCNSKLDGNVITQIPNHWLSDSVHSIENLAKRISELNETAITGQTLAMLGASQTMSVKHPVVHRAMEYIRSNFQKSISLEEVADHVYVSKSHLSYLFKEHTGSSFKQTLTRVRIQSAKSLLKNSPHKHVTEVSYEVGYADLRNFERNFKKELGVTPTQFRASVIRTWKN